DGLHTALPPELVPAVSDPTASVFIVSDSNNDPVAIAVANVNFPTAYCETGMIMEPVQFLKPLQDNVRKDVIKTAVRAVRDFGKAQGHVKHLFGLADEKCVEDNDLLNSIGCGPPLYGDPPSPVICMGKQVNNICPP